MDTATLPQPEARKKPRDYFGISLPNGPPLLEGDALRLWGIEISNRRRVRKKHADAIVESVDFIAVCIAQNWRCCICHNPMSPAKSVHPGFRITVEHDPAISVSHEHTRRTVKAAHWVCNIRKGREQDTTRAAKIKRVVKDEDLHAERMNRKARLTKEVRRILRREEAKLQSRNSFASPNQSKGRGLAGRGFAGSRKFDGTPVWKERK